MNAGAPALLAMLLLAPDLARAADPDTQIAGNPGAVNVAAGSGALGESLGFGPQSGVRLGGVLVSNANVLLSGGNAHGATSFNDLLVADLELDLDTLARIPGASVGTALLRFDGQPSNQQAGIVTGYNGLPGPPPLDRTELYELWWRQSLFADALVFRFGKLVPTNDFGNVVRPVPVQDLSLQIPAVSGLIYTPIFVNPTILGALPGYYNSAYGVTATITPIRHLYLSLGIYDGNLARGEQTGLRATPEFDSYRFQIGEIGTAWLLGAEHLPGAFAIGGWDQTGRLGISGPDGTITQDGTSGGYLFASQRLWRGAQAGGAQAGGAQPGGAQPGGTQPGDARGVSGFFQAGANDSRTMLATGYVGFGLTAFGIIPGRPGDSIGAGLAWSWLNRRLGFRAEEALLQIYDQIHVAGPLYLQPALSFSPTPGERTADGPVTAFTVQSTILF